MTSVILNYPFFTGWQWQHSS